jgi:hypothetical protein
MEDNNRRNDSNDKAPSLDKKQAESPNTSALGNQPYPPQKGSGASSLPNTGYPSQQRPQYPPQQGTQYPPQQGANPSQQSPQYPPQQGGANPPQQGTQYPPQQSGNYPPQQGYPPTQGSLYTPQRLPNISGFTWNDEPSEFTIASFFKETFSLLVNKPKIIFGITAIATFPPLILSELVMYFSDAQTLTGFLNLIYLVFVLASEGGIAHAIYTSEQEELPLLDYFKIGLAKTLTFILLFLLFFLALMLLAGITFILIYATKAPYLIGFILGIGFVFVYSMFFLTIPACVVEDLGVFAGLRRSVMLTRGHLIKIILFIILLCILSIAVFVLVFMDYIGSFSAADLVNLASPDLKISILIIIAYFFINSIGNAGLAVAYKNTRMELDSKDVTTYADVFN